MNLIAKLRAACRVPWFKVRIDVRVAPATPTPSIAEVQCRQALRASARTHIGRLAR